MSISRIGVAAALVSAAVLTGCTATRSTAAYPTTEAAESSSVSVVVTSRPASPAQQDLEKLVGQIVSDASKYWTELGVDMPKLSAVVGVSCPSGHQVKDAASCSNDTIVYVPSVIAAPKKKMGRSRLLNSFLTRSDTPCRKPRV